MRLNTIHLKKGQIQVKDIKLLVMNCLQFPCIKISWLRHKPSVSAKARSFSHFNDECARKGYVFKIFYHYQ